MKKNVLYELQKYELKMDTNNCSCCTTTDINNYVLHIHESHQLPFVTFATPKNVNFRIFIQAKLGKARIREQQINQVLRT